MKPRSSTRPWNAPRSLYWTASWRGSAVQRPRSAPNSLPKSDTEKSGALSVFRLGLLTCVSVGWAMCRSGTEVSLLQVTPTRFPSLWTCVRGRSAWSVTWSCGLVRSSADALEPRRMRPELRLARHPSLKVFKSICDSLAVPAPAWTFSMSTCCVMQDHPAHIPRASDRPLRPRTSGAAGRLPILPASSVCC